MEVTISNHVMKIYSGRGQYKLFVKIMEKRALQKRARKKNPWRH